MTFILTTLFLIVSFTMYSMLLERENIIKIACLSFLSSTYTYIIISGILFWIDSFHINLALLINLFIYIIVSLIMLIRGKRPTISYSIRKYAIPIIICIIMLPFIINRYGFFGMGQDEGVYQTHAISLMNGLTDIQQDFPEYETLNSTIDKNAFKASLEEDLSGLYNYDSSLSSLTPVNEKSPVSAFYHGIPTFAATLALWGRLFGIVNMSGILTLYYFMSIFLIYFILENLCIRKSLSFISTLLFSMSPIIIWVAKSTLTEIILVSMILLFLYYITAKNSKKEIILSTLPIVAFSFFHITIYTLLPLILLIYFLLFCYEKDHRYLISSAIVVICFLLGMTMTIQIAATYSLDNNLKPLMRILPFANQENILIYLWVSCILILLLELLLSKLVAKITFYNLHKKIASIALKLIYVFAICLIVLKICSSVKNTNILQAINHSTLVGFILLTGCIIMPVGIVYFLLAPKEIILKKTSIILNVCFVYCIFVYSIVFKPTIAYYYYYGRYLAPFISITIIFATNFINRRHAKRKTLALILIPSMVILMPYDFILKNGVDDTKMSWNILEDLATIIPENSAIVVEKKYMPYCYLTLRAMTHSNAFPANTDNIEDQLDQLSKVYPEVYYISSLELTNLNLQTVYTNYYQVSEDNNLHDGKIIPFPHEFDSYIDKIGCYKVIKAKTQYTITDNYDNFLGLSGKEGDFSWCSAETVHFNCYLDPITYTVDIEQGTPIPFDSLGIDSLLLTIYANNVKVDTIQLSNETNDHTLSFTLNSDLLSNGLNTLSFKCDTWNAQKLNSKDKRNLSFSIRSINFTAAEN